MAEFLQWFPNLLSEGYYGGKSQKEGISIAST